jgi:tRNA1(Val) A37 N6-methylase TrmN6
MMETDVTKDHVLGGKLMLSQPRHGHRVGTDAILLAAAAASLANGRVADFGAGVGAAGLALARLKHNLEALTLVEKNAELCRLARHNGQQVQPLATTVIECDLTARAGERHAAGLLERSYDLVITNPPFHPEGRSRLSTDTTRQDAHVMSDAALDLWIKAVNHHLKPAGFVVIIHRADALPRLLECMSARFGDIAIRSCHANAQAPATRILIAAKKGSRAPLRLLPSIILHETTGRMTAFATAIHRGEAIIPM